MSGFLPYSIEELNLPVNKSHLDLLTDNPDSLEYTEPRLICWCFLKVSMQEKVHDIGQMIVNSKDHYLLRFWKPLRKYSSAPFNGGVGFASRYINRHVPLDYNHEPELEIKEFLKANRYPAKETTVTLTSCETGKASHSLLNQDSFFVHISVTAGKENALAIGSDGAFAAGTVNIAVVTNATMDDSASLNLYQSIAEAKCQAFNDSGVRDRVAGVNAPGTSTDSISIFVGNEGESFTYGGRLSKIGKLASVEVYHMVLKQIQSSCL